MARVIIHVDLDAFYASIEQRDHPQWKGKPLVVGWQSPRGVVAAASYEARQFGIQSAMPMVEAQKRCPRLLVTPPRIGCYAQVSDQIHEIFRRYTPVIEPLSLDEAYLDVTAAQGQDGSGRQVAKSIKEAIQAELSLTASAGIGPSKCVAKIASDECKPNGLLEVTEAQVLEFLHPLPVARLWGVGPVTAKALAELGVTTIGQLATFEHDRLVGRFGSHGEQLFNLARGVDPRPVVPSRERKSISEEETFETDTENAEDVERVLREQAEAVAQRLQRHQVMGRTITVKIKLNESLGQGHYRELSRSRTLPDGTQSPEVIFREACRLFAVVPREEHKVRLVGVQISTLEPMGGSRQLPLFSDTP